MKNATILTTLEELFAVMDTRANVTIFKNRADIMQELLRSTTLYNLLSDYGFMYLYGKYKVIGLSVALGVTSILIEEA